MLNYAWLIFVPPLIALLINIFFGRRLGRTVSGWLGALAVGLSFVVAVGLYLSLYRLPVEERQVTVVLWDWITIGSFHPQIALLIDPLSVLMALVVTGVGFLIHVYSVQYMKEDDEHHDLDVRRYVRYFVYVNFFIIAMLILVLANNFVMLYMGWEGVGLASFLLISFWYHKPSARDAGKKAFLVNRIGDFGMALAIFLIFVTVGAAAGSLAYIDVYAAVAANPALLAGAAGAITLLLLLAATGKSAQIPLWVWLPDAMEGPTPVSALIHAATMVTAGVYLIVRTSPLFELAGDVLLVVAWIGGLTALMGATIALTKTDLKRILAYSTISQLGYMFLAVGSGAYAAGMFHLTTHALFKACLFLGAGSVMHALHGELDINKMGGLRHKMRSTYWTFLIAAATLAGFPIVTGGFWSKDAVLIGAAADGQWILYVDRPVHRAADRHLQLQDGVRGLLGQAARPETVRPRARVAPLDDLAAVDSRHPVHRRQLSLPAGVPAQGRRPAGWLAGSGSGARRRGSAYLRRAGGWPAGRLDHRVVVGHLSRLPLLCAEAGKRGQPARAAEFLPQAGRQRLLLRRRLRLDAQRPVGDRPLAV